MTDKAKQLLDAALELDIDERAMLIARLSDSLHDQIDPVLERAWIAECDKRWSAFQRGETQARPYEEVMREVRAMRPTNACETFVRIALCRKPEAGVPHGLLRLSKQHIAAQGARRELSKITSESGRFDKLRAHPIKMARTQLPLAVVWHPLSASSR